MATGKPAVTNRSTGPATAQQSIEQLQQRYQSLHTQKIQADTSLKHAQKQLADLQAQAREKYGSDDVAALQQKLADMKTENEDKRRQYQADLDQIETELQAVDAKFAGAGNEEPA